ncbi:MAG: (p)ppGpp synthetase [Hylemonella sp.]|uniref:GTP pyrophosphokinase n=1 Tax=Hylemonella sp. TaxID=2066020 RepID=UPI0022CADD89|nr:(p)ppGpp synthetase [Hylemonella sp.]MCZ8250915.1 (p)ppGpp synthetase [Hylemonella sp.]
MPSLDFELEKSEFRSFYEQNLSLLEDAKSSFAALLTALVTHSGSIVAAKIDGRIKDKEECIRKFSRKYRSDLEESKTAYAIAPYITDLIGLRIVCLYEDEIEKIAEVIRSHFEVIEVTDKVLAVESTEDSFGYKGLHMDLKLNATRALLPEYVSYAPLRFELQVRTIIQDSWSVLDHKIKYKKSIPNQLKRRINVLSALFELADREFRQIRDATEVALKEAPDETANQQYANGAVRQGAGLVLGSELNAFTFLKIANHFFKDFEFEPHKVDGFVHDIVELSPGITRAQFNRLMRETIAKVKRYKQAFEERNATDKLNPYTVIRHCLYLGDKVKFNRALTNVARDSFDDWLKNNL